MEDKEGKVWVQAEVKVRGKAAEWVVQARGQAQARAANAYVRSAGQKRRINAAHPALNTPVPSAGQRWFASEILLTKRNK